MRIPLSWLAEVVSWNEDTAALVERMTMTGLKVEAVEEVGDLDARIRVARLESVEPHPEAERLAICRLDLGGEHLTVVSAAPGLRRDRRVAVAQAGAALPAGRTVEAVALRGVTSEGVLCTEADLDLGEETGRVLELPGTTPGTTMRDLPGVRDTVVELEITPNRGDLLSILGVARDLAAVLGARLRVPPVRLRELGLPAAEQVRLAIEEPALCPRYAARIVRGVSIAAAPFAVRLRLRRAGMRPINAIVDATNYVMLERGQPLHAFDLLKIAEGSVVVRRARAGERLVTLDGVERTLVPDDLVIADPLGALALAGVMGGQASEVTDATRDVLLESAFFSPTAVRRTSRRLGLPSQAAYRFERRIDPDGVPAALDAVAAMIARVARGEVAPGRVEQAPGVAELAARPIRFRPARARALLGIAVSPTEMRRRLRALGMMCGRDGDALVVTPPSFRGDLAIEEDLAEEVARVGGYEAIPTTLPLIPASGGDEGALRQMARRVRRLLVAEGLSEMVTLSLTDPETNRLLPGWVGEGVEPILLANALSSELSELRRSPLAGLARAARLNRAHGAGFVGAFELGTGFGRDGQGAVRERRAIAGLLCGAWPPRGAERSGPPVDFFDLKGVVQNLLAGLGLGEDEVGWRPAGDSTFLHPGKTARVEVAGQAIGIAGALHPGIAQTLDLAGEVWLFELDFTKVAHYRPRRVALRSLPRFPAVTRDIALVVDESFLAETILEEIRAWADPLVESASLFDCYRGMPVPEGKKSLAYTIAYRAADRTLTDDEANAAHDRVRAHLSARFALTLRS
ncbi:MAG TPA: phenylalanine--tRNA ligase subunit beta [Candidatus Binatia bacterium]|nr:phenylalanine--tRNA ligase subunit beta [Candidatus Binatia bacterium]